MKAGWTTKPLGELCDVLDSRRKPITKRDRNAGEYPYYGATGIQDHVEGYLFDEPLILVGEDGAKWASGENTAFSVQGKCWVNNHAHVLRPHRSQLVDNWLVHFLVHADLSEFVSGLTVPKLNQSSLREIPVPLPPLSEQQRIVGILDKACEGLTAAKINAEANLQNARALFESELQSVFTRRSAGWISRRLKALTTKIGSGATPRGGEESYKAQGISLIRSMNVHDMGFRYKKLAFLDGGQAAELSNVVVKPGDVLLNITGASVARCCMAPEDVLPARVNQHVSIIRTITDRLDGDFLHYLLISEPYKIQLLQTGEGGGSTRQAITKAQIQEFEIEYPEDLAEQKSIAVRLKALSNETKLLEDIYFRKLTAIAHLKRSMFDQAFTGQLTAAR